jgi:hypothetical protein
MNNSEKNDSDSISSVLDEIDSYFGSFKYTSVDKFTNENCKEALNEIAIKYQRVSVIWSLVVFICVSIQFPSLLIVFLLAFSILLIAVVSSVPFLIVVCGLSLYFLTVALFLSCVLVPFFVTVFFSFVPLFVVSLFRSR